MSAISMHRLPLLTATTLAVMAAGCATISPQQEAEMGLNYAQQINAQLPIVRDPEANAYMNRLGDSLAVLVDDQGRNWRFSIVSSKASRPRTVCAMRRCVVATSCRPWSGRRRLRTTRSIASRRRKRCV